MIYIFGIDNTLALNAHRQHLIAGLHWKDQDWAKFSRTCDLDIPNETVISMVRILKSQPDTQIYLITGRYMGSERKTRSWLKKYNVPFDKLIMRGRNNDPEEILKSNLFDAVIGDKTKVAAVFDDRQKVVDMWRAKGLTCFEVAEGNY